MAKVPNGVETLPKISIARVGCTNVTTYRRQTDDRSTDRQTDRRQTDGRRHIANMNMSSRSLKRERKREGKKKRRQGWKGEKRREAKWEVKGKGGLMEDRERGKGKGSEMEKKRSIWPPISDSESPIRILPILLSLESITSLLIKTV